MLDEDFTTEQRMRMRSVELAVELTLQDEALFSGSTIRFAERIFKFINTGAVETAPLKE